MRKRMNRICFAFGLFLAIAIVSQMLTAQTPARKTAPATQSKFKAIWEPVNVKEDLALTSVNFVSPDEGWVTGGTDFDERRRHCAHERWWRDVGDPVRRPGIRRPRLRPFAFSRCENRLRRSMYGQRRSPSAADDGWEDLDAGRRRQTAPERLPVRVSTVGFVSAGDDILRTSDGGKKWTSVYECRVKAEVQGLTRDMPCQVSALYFVDANTGFGVTRDLGRRCRRRVREDH